MRFARKGLSILLSAVILCSATPVFAGSIGSVANDKAIGSDPLQNAVTTYGSADIADGGSSTDVYLTVDNSQLIVGVPTTVILNGEPDENGKYEGDYSIYAKGDIAGDQTLNIYPETDTVVMKQKGKLNKEAEIKQNLISFVSADIVDGMTTTGTISAESLSAGSWNGNFNFVISMIDKAVYYSSIELAVADANNLTTENADVKRENASDAVAAMYIQNETAYVRMMNNEDNVQSMTAEQDTIIDLNDYTVTFAQGQYFTANDDLSIYDGIINTSNSNYVINASTGDTSLTVSNLTLNSVANANCTTNTFAIRVKSETMNIDDVNINVESANSKAAAGIICSNTVNSTSNISNCNIDIHNTSSGQARGMQVLGNVTLSNNDVSTETVNADSICIFASSTDTNTVFSNGGNYVATSNSGVAKSFQCAVKTKAIINGGRFYAESKNGASGCGISTSVASSVSPYIEINSTKDNPVIVYGKQWGLATSEYGNIVINGGTYTSTNHTAYIGGNADVYDAKFYIANRDKYTSSQIDTSFGLYCGGSNSAAKNCIVNFYNCVIGTPIDKASDGNISEQTITAKYNGYYAPKEINMYDTILYSGTVDTFDFNWSSKWVKSYTKMNLYGDTKIMKNSVEEVSKEVLAEDIDWWFNTHTTTYALKTGEGETGYGATMVSPNRLIRGHYYCDTDTDDKSFAYESDAGVYDYRL